MQFISLFDIGYGEFLNPIRSLKKLRLHFGFLVAHVLLSSGNKKELPYQSWLLQRRHSQQQRPASC